MIKENSGIAFVISLIKIIKVNFLPWFVFSFYFKVWSIKFILQRYYVISILLKRLLVSGSVVFSKNYLSNLLTRRTCLWNSCIAKDLKTFRFSSKTFLGKNRITVTPELLNYQFIKFMSVLSNLWHLFDDCLYFLILIYCLIFDFMLCLMDHPFKCPLDYTFYSWNISVDKKK